MKKIILTKEKFSNRELITYINPVKRRIPTPPKGYVMVSKRDKIKSNRQKITIDNWDRLC